MNTKITSAIIACLAIIAIGLVLSKTDQDHEHAPEKTIRHYQAAKPANTEEALAILTEKTALIEGLLQNKPLNHTEFESIHEASYSLEAAVDHLRAQQHESAEKLIDTVDEAVQAIHYASENHEETKTRQWISALTQTINEVNHVF